MNLIERFNSFDGEYMKFESIENPPSKRPDLCAFVLLDKIITGEGYMVCAAEHDEIWLDVDVDEIPLSITDEEIKYLVRCGVIIDEDNNCLAMFA